MVEFAFLGYHVRVCPGGRDEIIVTDELADPRPRHPAEVEMLARREYDGSHDAVRRLLCEVNRRRAAAATLAQARLTPSLAAARG